jgi:hypothetical protein
VHRIEDIKPSQNPDEHLVRVLSRENTPWINQDKAIGTLASKFKQKKSSKL